MQILIFYFKTSHSKQNDICVPVTWSIYSKCQILLVWKWNFVFRFSSNCRISPLSPCRHVAMMYECTTKYFRKVCALQRIVFSPKRANLDGERPVIHKESFCQTTSEIRHFWLLRVYGKMQDYHIFTRSKRLYAVCAALCSSYSYVVSVVFWKWYMLSP